MIQAKKLYKKYGLSTILADISFSVGRGQKIALVGNNGTGKTTLLKIIAGIEDVDEGTLTVESNICIGYLPQDTSLLGSETVAAYIRRVVGIDALEKEIKDLSADPDSPKNAKRYALIHKKYEQLDGYAFDHRIKIMLAGFGLEGVEIGQNISNLSSGQKSKIVLAGILLKGVDLLLLDEPTNNLDLPALIWLEDFLKKTTATCIVVSHDRRFLDRVVQKIFEIDWHTRLLTIRSGTYSQYLEMLAKQIARQKEAYYLQQEEIGRLRDSAQEKRADAASGTKFVGTDNDKFLRGFKRDQAGRSSRTAKIIEKRIGRMDTVEKPFERDPFEICLDAQADSGTHDIRLVDIIIGYLDSFTVGPISLEIRYGSRIGVMGLNGSGKSTLFKTIAGRLPLISGTIEIGSGITIGNMMQEHETLPRNDILLTFLIEKAHVTEQESHAKLAKFGFSENQVRLPISTLSPGGRARLLLALFSAQSVNTLILDEPTNHLDLEALDALEETLKTYAGTVILVSHDRYFLEKASLDSLYVLSEGRLTKIPDYKVYVASAEEKARKLLKML